MSLRYIALLLVATVAHTESSLWNEPVRRAYSRGEQADFSFRTAPGAKVRFSANGWMTQESVADEDGKASYHLNTRHLRPGAYTLFAHSESVSDPATLSISIGPELHDDGIPLIRWGHLYDRDNVDWLMAHGFTGGTPGSITNPKDLSGKTKERLERIFEHAVKRGFLVRLYFNPMADRKGFFAQNESTRVLLSNGRRMDNHPWPGDPLSPLLQKHAVALAESTADLFGSYPVWRYAMLNSEHVTAPGINPEVLALAKTDLGLNFKDYLRPGTFTPIPEALRGQSVVADREPHYLIRKWFYETGNGTPAINAKVATAFREKRPDLQLSFEPWRLAPVRDVAKGMDYIGSWTYAYNDLKRLFFGTYLRAPGRLEMQKVEAILTLFVYGHMVMPISDSTARISDDQPGKDPYFNANPDYTKEALWIYLAQRPDLISIYWGSSLPPHHNKEDDFLVQRDSFNIIGSFSRRILQPYGPTIRQSRPEQAKVGVHLSALSNWFTSRKPGWNKCEETLPYTSLLVMNHVPFEILLDDDITEKDRLGEYHTLVLPHPDSITTSMQQNLRTFTQQGGRLIINGSNPALLEMGAHVTQFDFTPLDAQSGRVSGAGEPFTTAESARSLMERYAAELAPLVADIRGRARAKQQRVITTTLEAGEVNYHFVINDDRTYGPAFGKHQLYFEHGVRQRAELALQRPPGTHFYELPARRELRGEWTGQEYQASLWLPAADGCIIASLPGEPAAPRLIGKLPQLQRGQSNQLKVELPYTSGQRIQGAVPLQVTILDGAGTEILSRYLSASDGTVDLPVHVAHNDAPGKWTFSITEMISGKKTDISVQCK